jgi:hypothetical protein
MRPRLAMALPLRGCVCGINARRRGAFAVGVSAIVVRSHDFGVQVEDGSVSTVIVSICRRRALFCAVVVVVDEYPAFARVVARFQVVVASGGKRHRDEDVVDFD